MSDMLFLTLAPCKYGCVKLPVHNFMIDFIIVTWIWKIDQIVTLWLTFGILRKTNFKLWNFCRFFVLDYNHGITGTVL